MINLVCLLEEPSAKEMLTGVLPRLIPHDVDVKFIIFEGKQDLEKQLIKRIRLWQMPDSVFLIMRDKDSGNCNQIKQALMEKIQQTGRQIDYIVRIACHELESFYLGDFEAVENGLGVSNLSRLANRQIYRNPDLVSNASEQLVKITNSGYQKVSGSRLIGPHLRLDGSNRSHSFNVLIAGIRRLLSL